MRKSPAPKSIIEGPGKNENACAIKSPVTLMTPPNRVDTVINAFMLFATFFAIEAGMIVSAPMSSVPTSLIPKDTMSAKRERRRRSNQRPRPWTCARSAVVVRKRNCRANPITIPAAPRARPVVMINASGDNAGNPPKRA